MRTILFVLLGFVLGCIFMFHQYNRTIDLFNLETPIAVLHGKASFYGAGDGFDGKPMANGRCYDKEAMTAAHRTLRLGSKVRVIDGTRSVILLITDRGPYKKGRIIDLSEAAARKLGMIERGVDQITIEVLYEPEEDITYHHENHHCLDKKDTEAEGPP